MVFISFYIMQTVKCSVLCFPESVHPISGFPNSKTCSSFSVPHSHQDTDRFLSSLFRCHIENISYLKYPGIKILVCFSIGARARGAKTDASPGVSSPSSLVFNLYLPLSVPLFSLLDHVGLHLLLLFLASLGDGLHCSIFHKRDIQTRPQKTVMPFTNDLTPVQILSFPLFSSFASSFS